MIHSDEISKSSVEYQAGLFDSHVGFADIVNGRVEAGFYERGRFDLMSDGDDAIAFLQSIQPFLIAKKDDVASILASVKKQA